METSEQIILRRDLAKSCILLEAINSLRNVFDCPKREYLDIAKDKLSSTTPAIFPESPGTYADFQDFLNRLAEVCSFENSPRMVTAIIVEKSGQKFIFHATRNGVNGLKDKQDLRNSLQRVLEMISRLKYTDTGVPVRDVADFIPLHISIIADHFQRIEAYTRDLTRSVANCKKASRNLSSKFRNELEALDNRLRDASKRDTTEFRLDQILCACSKFLHKYKDHVDALGKARPAISEPWKQLFHLTGRLRSYYKSLWRFHDAKQWFPELFENFEVNVVDPAQVAPVPCTWSLDQVRKEFKSEGKDMWDEKDVAMVHEKIKELSVEPPGRFNRIVHAEVHLANWFFNERLGGKKPSESQAQACFSRGWGYVASSKPCCRFCYDFFALGSTSFLCRSAHFKTFARWTLPEFSLCRSEEAKKQLETAYKVMDNRVRDQIRVKLGKLEPESAERRNCSEDDFSDLE